MSEIRADSVELASASDWGVTSDWAGKEQAGGGAVDGGLIQYDPKPVGEKESRQAASNAGLAGAAMISDSRKSEKVRLVDRHENEDTNSGADLYDPKPVREKESYLAASNGGLATAATISDSDRSEKLRLVDLRTDEDAGSSADLLFFPRPDSQAGATRAQAHESLERTFTALNVPDPAGLSRALLPGASTIPMSAMASAATALMLSSFGNIVSAVKKALDIQTERQVEASTQRLTEYLDQLQKQSEDMEKARKSGIFNAVFDWVSGAAEVTSGLVRLVVFADPGGLVEVAAGVMGLCKAAMETIALTFGEDAINEDVLTFFGFAQASIEAFGLLTGTAGIGITLKSVLGFGMAVNEGVIGIERAGLEQDAAKAGLRMDFQQLLIDATERDRNGTMSNIQDLYGKVNSIVSATSDALTGTSNAMSKIATSLGGASSRFA